MQNHRNLLVSARTLQLATETYRLTGHFPSDERFGLTAQMRRAAVSIGSNIAEGCGRDTNADFARFLYIALGSANELEYHLLLARDLKFLADDAYRITSHEATGVKMMLSGLIGQVQPSVNRQFASCARSQTVDRQPSTVNRKRDEGAHGH